MVKVRILVVLLAAGLHLGSAVSVLAQEAQPLRFTTRALEVTVSGRVQTLFSTTTEDDVQPALLELRRVRTEFGVRANEYVSGMIQPEFAGSTISLRDAYLQFSASPAFRLRVGQAFRPFGAIPQTSSTRILPIERGTRIRGLQIGALDHYNLVADLGYADRDIGLQIQGAPPGAPLGFSYAAGVFNGPLRGRVGGELTYQVGGRVTATPVSDLRLGVGWSQRDFAQVTGTDDDEIVLRRGDAWQADLQYGSFAPGFHLIAEAAVGDLNPFAEPGTTAVRRFRSAQTWFAYRTPSLGPALTNIEPVLRLSYGDAEGPVPGGTSQAAGGTLLTPGLNFYFGPLNRIMVNYDMWNPQDAELDRAASFKVMFQMAF